MMAKYGTILSHPARTFWDLGFFFFFIFQNQSAAGDVFQQIKKESLIKYKRLRKVQQLSVFAWQPWCYKAMTWFANGSQNPNHNETQSKPQKMIT